MRLWAYLDNYSPLVVRLCARRSIGGKHVVALSSQEIAITSGLPALRVAEISWLLEWDEVLVGEARRFCAACNFDPTSRLDRERQAAYARRCLTYRPNQYPEYLRQSPLWQTEFLPLLRHLRSSPPPSRKSPAMTSGPTNFSTQRERMHVA